MSDFGGDNGALLVAILAAQPGKPSEAKPSYRSSIPDGRHEGGNDPLAASLGLGTGDFFGRRLLKPSAHPL